MKVLHVITGLGVGGAELQVRSILQHTRHDSEVVTLYNPGPVADMIRSDGGRVRDVGMTRNTEVSALLRLRGLIRRGGYDVVHAHLYRSQVYGRSAAWLAGTPVVLSTEHSIGETHLERRKMTRGVRALYLATEMLSDTTIAVSGTVRERLENWGVRPQAGDRHPERRGPAAGGVRRHGPAADPRRVRGRPGRLPDRRARPARPEQAVRPGHRGSLGAAVGQVKLLIVGKGDEQAHLDRSPAPTAWPTRDLRG